MRKGHLPVIPGDDDWTDGDAWERVARITRLYLVVHGRPPDPGGLATFVQHLRNGASLQQVAADFVASDEFVRHVGNEDAAALLCRNALGPDDGGTRPHPAHGSLGELATSLVLSPAVRERLAVLPALYPQGVPINNPVAYRIWLSRNAEKRPHSSGTANTTAALSFIAIVHRPVAAWLQATIASVLAEPFLHTEIVLVTSGVFPKTVRRAALTNPRIRLVRAPFWYGTAALFNHALARCRGAFAGLIGQHDQLDGTATPELAQATAAADIVITDDDALDANDQRHSPRLGSAWDPERVIASGCPGLILIRTALLRQVGGMQPAKGQEEWALLLRLAAIVAETRIAHVASIALSRRTAYMPHGTHPIHHRIVQDYLRATGDSGCIVRGEESTLRVIHSLPATPPRASIIIPTRDRADLLRICTEGLLRRTSYPDMELIVVDNGSTEPDAVALLKDLAAHCSVHVLAAPGPFNWSALNNAGVDRMRGDIAVLLNNDIDVIDPDWLRELVSQAIRPKVGVVGAKLLYPDRTIQHAGIVLGPAARATHMWRHVPDGDPGYLQLLAVTRQVTALTGACLALRRDVYLAAGGCEQENLPITWNDVDLCLRIRGLGLRAIWSPHARLLHLEQATRGSDESAEPQRRYQRERSWMKERWNVVLDSDPFLNPQLRPSEDPRETDARLIAVTGSQRF